MTAESTSVVGDTGDPGHLAAAADEGHRWRSFQGLDGLFPSGLTEVMTETC